MGGLVTRLLVVLVMVLLGTACAQERQELIHGTWVQDDGARIEFLEDNRVVQQPSDGREVRGRYEWRDSSTIRMTRNHATFGIALEMATHTVLAVTSTELFLQDERGQIAGYRRP